MTTKILTKFPVLLLALICTLLLQACGGEGVGFVIEGTIEGHANGKISLELFTPPHNTQIDSAVTDEKGHFSFTTGTHPEGIYALRLPNQQRLLVYASAEPVHVEGKVGQFDRAEITGSKGSAILSAFSNRRSRLRNDYVRENRDLNRLSKDNNPVEWAQQEKDADAKAVAYRDYITTFVDTVSLPELAHYAIYNLNVNGDYYCMQQYADAQLKQGVSSPIVRAIESDCKAFGDRFVRFEIADFTLPTYRGEELAFSSYRGKVVYFYVWASYCGLSRLHNQRLAAWYNSHPDSKVEIVSFSIDLEEEAWRKAIAEDSMTWPAQYRGLYEWNSPEIKQMNVNHIPTSFLVDARGIIRSKAIHPEELARDYDKIVAEWGK